MARSTLKIRYDGTAAQYPLEINNIGFRRFIRHTFVPGELFDVTDIATPNELARDAAFAALLTANTFAIVQTPGNDESGVSAGQLAPVASAGTIPIGVPFVMRVAMTAGTPGTADDVTVFSLAVPFRMRLLDAWAVISTAIGATTLSIRDTAAGAGTLMVPAIASAAAGLNRAAGTTPTVTSQVAENGSLFIRRSDRGVAGTVFIMAVKE